MSRAGARRSTGCSRTRSSSTARARRRRSRRACASRRRAAARGRAAQRRAARRARARAAAARRRPRRRRRARAARRAAAPPPRATLALGARGRDPDAAGPAALGGGAVAVAAAAQPAGGAQGEDLRAVLRAASRACRRCGATTQSRAARPTRTSRGRSGTEEGALSPLLYDLAGWLARARRLRVGQPDGRGGGRRGGWAAFRRWLRGGKYGGSPGRGRRRGRGEVRHTRARRAADRKRRSRGFGNFGVLRERARCAPSAAAPPGGGGWVAPSVMHTHGGSKAGNIVPAPHGARARASGVGDDRRGRRVRVERRRIVAGRRPAGAAAGAAARRRGRGRGGRLVGPARRQWGARGSRRARCTRSATRRRARPPPWPRPGGAAGGRRLRRAARTRPR